MCIHAPWLSIQPFKMDFSKFSAALLRPIPKSIALSALLILLLLLSPFVVKPDVQAVTHAVLQAVTIPNNRTPSIEAEPGIGSILREIVNQQGEPITLPFLRARDQRSELVKFIYSITLDEKTLGANRALLDKDALTLENTYGLLFVQIIDGGDFYLNGHWVAGLARSTEAERWIWFEPFIVPLPTRLLKTDGTPNVLTLSQSTHEPYISISRLYFGDLDELKRIYGVVHFFTTTLVNTFIVLGFAAGLLFLGIWTVSPKERIYAVAGGVSILWAAMIMVFRQQQASTEMQELLRWFVYASRGGVICLMTLFIFSFIDRTPGLREKCTIFGLSGAAAVVYAVGGSPTEPYLNLLWPPAVFLLYAYAIALLIGYWRKTRSVPAGLFLLQSVLFLLLAFHSYAMQARLMDKLSNSGLEAGWSGLFFEHIASLFLAMPFMLLALGYMLLTRYRDNVIELGHSQLFLEQREIELKEIHHKREIIAHSEATLSERERIYQDIHDGIGSQLVKAIFSLRNTGAASSAVLHNLQACLDDLRLVIDAQPESDVDIETTVFAFCVTQELHLEGSCLAISYHVGLESTVYTDPKVNLNVLRVLQESLSNTLKHSGATFIDVNLGSNEFFLILTITDNGHGHLRSTHQRLAQQSAFGSSGNRGITGLSRRAADIGATYAIDITESGTTVRLSIPLPSDVEINAERPTRAEINLTR